MRDRDRLALVLILLLGASLRLFHLDAAFLDTHAWRQLDTAAMARNFYEDGSSARSIRKSTGAAATVTSRLSSRSFRPSSRLCIASLVCTRRSPVWSSSSPALASSGRSTGCRWRSTAGYRRRAPRHSCGRVADGRVLRPHRDTGYADDVLPRRGADRLRRVRTTRFEEVARRLAAVCLTIACLLKLPAVFVGPAIVTALVQAKGWRVFRDPLVWVTGVVPLALTARLVLARARDLPATPD